MAITYFDPIHTPLLQGINLIEASAGTGKTYAIAMLVLRFVVEREVDIKKMLVVTFTKAATEELKDRIRNRLAEAKSALSGKTDTIDSNITDWLETLSLEPGIIKSRLDLALLDIDQAGIFTIHGFCQRILSEHALESGELFDSELTGEVDAIKQACADDFWRIQVYPRQAWEAALLTAHYPSPDALLTSVRNIPPHITVFPAEADLEQALATFKQNGLHALTQLPVIADTLKTHFAEGAFKPAYVDNFDANQQLLMTWLQTCLSTSDLYLHESPRLAIMLPDFNFLSSRGLKEGLNGTKFKTTKTQSGEQRKADYLAKLSIDCAGFDALAECFKQISLAFRRALLEYLRANLDKRMQQLNVLSFDDLINRLAGALEGAKGAFLTAELQQRFSVALIDEFQDTDQKQWFIFSSLFALNSHSLYLIGDPKQAIYKFRGADIYSYFNAQQLAQHHFTLGFNWRSHPQLVQATNSLFRREQPFLFSQVSFTPVKPGLEAREGALSCDGATLPPLHLWQLAESDGANGYWSAGNAAGEIRIAITHEILKLLKGRCVLVSKTTQQALQPRDIAILVKTNQQARDYQHILREAGVPAVLNSTESVFAAPEALDLYRLLQALANPGELGLLKQALTLRWFNLNGQQLFRTINDEALLDAWIFRFQDYYQTWLKKGFMAMMQQVLSAEKITLNLSGTRLAERRLTNLQHLIELIQQAALNEHLGIHKTLDWLRTAITQAEQTGNSPEERQLRLESDEDAVKIVTMHRSKGLEYAIVFCPFLWQRNDYLNSERHLIQCHENGRMIADIGSKEFEKRRLQALQEELAEDLRIFYVAVTRAKYRCYLVWADVRSKDKPNNSAMAYLFDFAEADFNAQQQRLQAFVEKQPEAFYYQKVVAADVVNDTPVNSIDTQNLTAKQRKRNLFTSWQMSSYTALSALSLADAPELPEDKVNEIGISAEASLLTDVPEFAVDLLPKGIQTGNVIHALLENLSFSQCTQAAGIAQARDSVCQRYALKPDDPGIIDQLLARIVTTPLSAQDSSFCLKNLKDQHCLKELPFYLSMQTLDVSQINPILESCPAYQPLTAKQMSGFLTGFIDLICFYQGRYYVIDYKTNSLPDYQSASLINAMREHNYGLQYWLYSVVLHRYLQQRLPDYRYARHFGGVRYLFVRGMQPEIGGSGVYEDLPGFDALQKLAGLFGSIY